MFLSKNQSYNYLHFIENQKYILIQNNPTSTYWFKENV